jgi:hypothetical protein
MCRLGKRLRYTAKFAQLRPRRQMPNRTLFPAYATVFNVATTTAARTAMRSTQVRQLAQINR